MITVTDSILRSVPPFLAPALLRSLGPKAQHLNFSTSTSRARAKRGFNAHRGVSALRRTGPRYKLSIDAEPLPQPVLEAEKRSKVKVRDDHGLWDFFTKERKAPITPEKMSEHGRSWTVEELRYKSFEDLHCLWWVCLKEMNRIRTLEYERERINAGYGRKEAEDRIDVIKKTQKAIKFALTERWYAWEDAKRIERSNPEQASELMGVPLDSFVDADIDDADLPPGESLTSAVFDSESPQQPRQGT